jgi:hypothetical protein
MKRRTVHLLVGAAFIVAILLVGYLMYSRRVHGSSSSSPLRPLPPFPPSTPIATSMQISSDSNNSFSGNDTYTIVLTGPTLGTPTYGTNSVMWSNGATSIDPVTQKVLTALAGQPMLISGISPNSVTITFLNVSGATNNARYQLLASIGPVVGQGLDVPVNVPVAWTSS